MFGYFNVWVGVAGPDKHRYPVRVFDSPAGPAEGVLDLDVTGAAFGEELILARGTDPDLKLRKSVGSRLYKALFQGGIGDAWKDSQGWIDGQRGEGLHLRLWIEPPELAVLPWELLWEENGNRFLATAADLGLARYLPVREPAQPPGQGPLRVLVVIESPPKVQPVDAEEIKSLKQALGALEGVGKVRCQTLTNADAGAIYDELQQGDYHVVHYLGHGTSGKLVLTSKDGTGPAPIEDQAFAQLVLGRRGLRLIVLNACHSSQADQGGVFAGVGPSLVEKRVPAVVAMQYHAVLQSTAGQFSAALYNALALGRPVDVAVNQARQALSVASLPDRDWSTPVLYLGTRSFRILDPDQKEERDAELAWRSVREAVKAPEARAALDELSQRLREFAARHRALDDLLALARFLHNLRSGFEPCVRRVEKTKGQAAALHGLEFKADWTRVAKNELTTLTSFVENHFEPVPFAWYQKLLTCQGRIEKALPPDSALLILVQGTEEMSGILAQAEEDVRQRTERAVAELATASDQTLAWLTRSVESA
ncbi:MAG: CHAT domain-containing protein [Gemmataceae bacterium]|nr:CHAT domain-containing protein [Gemmataceae bacterium]